MCILTSDTLSYKIKVWRPLTGSCIYTTAIFLFQSVMQYPCCHLTYFSKNSIARPKVYTTEKQVVARLVV